MIRDIHFVNPSTFDLNLLRVLDALLREQNVSRAADRLALSQPAVSNALSRLRELFGDPLLVRIGRRMQPTLKALALQGPIRAALQQIEQTLGTRAAFDPTHSRKQFRVALTDHLEQVCMPRLLARLSDVAPGIRIDVTHVGPELPTGALDKGELDLAIGYFAEIPARFGRQHWRSETFKVALRRGHPLLGGDLDVNKFMQLRHLQVHGEPAHDMVDQWLAARGMARQIVYTTPHYLQAAHIAATSDLCVVLPAQLAREFAVLLSLQVLDLPFDVGAFSLELVFVGQHQSESGLNWLIREIQAVGVESAPENRKKSLTTNFEGIRNIA